MFVLTMAAINKVTVLSRPWVAYDFDNAQRRGKAILQSNLFTPYPRFTTAKQVQIQCTSCSVADRKIATVYIVLSLFSHMD